MSDLQATADRVKIEAIRGEFTDAVMMCDHDRLASLFTPDGAVRIPLGNIESAGREEIRAMASGGRLSRTTSCRPRTRPRWRSAACCWSAA
jgi:hypothetical protein